MKTLKIIFFIFICIGVFNVEFQISSKKNISKKPDSEDYNDVEVRQKWEKEIYGNFDKAWLKAVEQVELKLKTRGAIYGVNWNERVPNNQAGQTRELMFNPNDPNDKKVWAGSVSGDLWYKDDITYASCQLHNVNDFWDNLAVTSIAYNPVNNVEFVLLTDEDTLNVTFVSVHGNGLFNSINVGHTWQTMECI